MHLFIFVLYSFSYQFYSFFDATISSKIQIVITFSKTVIFSTISLSNLYCNMTTRECAVQPKLDRSDSVLLSKVRPAKCQTLKYGYETG